MDERDTTGTGPVVGYFVHAAEGASYLGAMLIATPQGDPTDFVYTEAVTVSSFHRALLGRRLAGWMAGRVLAPALLAQVSHPPVAVCADDEALLARPPAGAPPWVVVGRKAAPHAPGWASFPLDGGDGALWIPDGAADGVLAVVRRAHEALAPEGLRETFGRARAALAEVRKDRRQS